MSDRGICLTCEYFDPQAEEVAFLPEADKGLCRRYPPQAHYDHDEDAVATVWPMVDMAEHCGEWRQA